MQIVHVENYISGYEMLLLAFRLQYRYSYYDLSTHDSTYITTILLAPSPHFV